ncbi:MAG: DEAD/DEAH box helicase, partial [Vulcanisaeta sp.]
MPIFVRNSEDLLLDSSFRMVHRWVDGEVKPSFCGLRFRDFFGGFIDGFPNSELEMFSHQCRTAEALFLHHNIILTAGTGSGKTEAWAIPAMVVGFKSLVIYPNKALAGDQVRRLQDYAEVLSKRIGEIHADLDNLTGYEDDVVITNPAYLMTIVKRGKGKLARFLSKLNLIVIDEFAFYSPAQQQLLIELLRLITQEYSKPIIAILTATLSGLDQLRGELSSINGRKTDIIEGLPSKRVNITYIVEDGDLVKYLVNLMRSGEDAATIVFVETINTAEKILRKVKTSCSDCPIATHHSRLSRDRRREVEDGLRNGTIKVAVSPRTLEQGIDIGMVARV